MVVSIVLFRYTVNGICWMISIKYVVDKHGTAYRKCKTLHPVIDIVYIFDKLREEDKSDDEIYVIARIGVEESMNMRKSIIDKFIKHKYINCKLGKIEDIVNEGDAIEVLNCYG